MGFGVGLRVFGVESVERYCARGLKSRYRGWALILTTKYLKTEKW